MRTMLPLVALLSVAAIAAEAPDTLVRALNGVPTTASLSAFHELLATEPHIAGTEGDARNIQRLRDAFVQMGLCTVVEEFWSALPHPQGAVLEIIEGGAVDATTAAAGASAVGAQAPPARRGVVPLALVERNLLEDPATAHPGLTYGWNAFSASGDVTAEVVYANYGTKADFESLRSQGVEVKGKIVLARYGGNFRGYKWRFAEQAGAAGLVIFTDPADSGEAKGKTYPEGGWANDTCIQRGSILALDYPGDPQTPGAPATQEAVRAELDDLPLPRIPVQPIGYAAAAQIMARMKGAEVAPESGWKGGMPVAYRLTGGPELQLHLVVQQDRRVRKSANVIATLTGRTNPDQCVVVGCHHDAWGFGAADPLAGTMVLMECARSFAAAAARGMRPDRTVIFAAWGAEEYGIIGSTEWAEGHAAELMRGAVAYINLDMAAMGPRFGAACTPSLRDAILSATVRVAQARGAAGETVYDRLSGGGRSSIRFGELGGGSDHIAFNCHLGVASMSLGSDGSEGSSYHSNYDTVAWYRKVVGADYEPALMLTRMTNAVAGMLADSPVVPLSAGRHGGEAVRYIEALRPKAQDPAMTAALDKLAALANAVADRGAKLDAALASATGTLDEKRCRELSNALIAMDRAWLDEAGLNGRPWFRSLLVASDRDSGYASVMLPLLAEALEAKDPAAVQQAAVRYEQALARIHSALDAAFTQVQAPPAVRLPEPNVSTK